MKNIGCPQEVTIDATSGLWGLQGAPRQSWIYVLMFCKQFYFGFSTAIWMTNPRFASWSATTCWLSRHLLLQKHLCSLPDLPKQEDNHSQKHAAFLSKAFRTLWVMLKYASRGWWSEHGRLRQVPLAARIAKTLLLRCFVVSCFETGSFQIFQNVP